MKITVFILLLVGFSLPAISQPADAITGTWITQNGQGKIQMYKNGDRYFGRLVEGNELTDAQGQLVKDVNNPDEQLRNRPLKGLVLLRDFVYKDGIWEDGTVYDPESGKTYQCFLKVENGNLEVTGYLGFKWLSRTVIWTRAPEP